MKRSILLALVAALALTVGANVATSAADGGVQAAAKKKAAKCPAKPKKGKKKAGKSLADSAAKKKAKKKAAKCKAKPKKKAKAKPKPPAGPKGPGTPPPPPPPGTVFGDGTYKDGAKTFQVQVLNNGQNVDVGFLLPASNGCPGIPLMMGTSEPLARGATQAHAGESFNAAGIVQVTWDLTVQLPSLSYVLKIDSEYSTPPCTGQTTYQGTLVKQ